MQVCHRHCPPEGSGLGVLAVVVAAVVLAVTARPVAHAAEAVAEVAVLVLASFAALAVTVAAVWLAARLRRRALARRHEVAELTARAPVTYAITDGRERQALVLDADSFTSSHAPTTRSRYPGTGEKRSAG